VDMLTVDLLLPHQFFDADTFLPYLRQILLQALNIATMIAGGLMSWKALCLVTNSASPVVVVLS
jgi:hypothetical protein